MKLIDIRDLLLEREKAYHGSSHRFNFFQDAGIGGGTGAQAFGWGLYFAKQASTALGYSRAGHQKDKTLFHGLTPEELGLKYENPVFYSMPRANKAEDLIDYANDQISLLEDEEFEGVHEIIEQYKQFIEIIKEASIEKEESKYVYVVTLFPNKDPDYLNWNINVPEHQWLKINKQAEKENISNLPKHGSGGQLYEFLSSHLKEPNKDPQKNASLFLLRAGIDGITHSNGTVRIVFDPKEIEIEKRYKLSEFNEK